VKASASTAMSLPAATTTIGNTLIVGIAARDISGAGAIASGEANANLTSLTERMDSGTVDGNGGGLIVYTGVKAAPGSTGNTTATVTSTINAYMTVALKPPAFPMLGRNIFKYAVSRAANW